MKHLLILIPALLFALLSCKSSIQKKITGKWKGEGIETSANGITKNKFTHQSEFTTDGSFIETAFDITTGAPYSPVVYSYDIEGDSIIWINKVGNRMLTRSRIESISDMRLLYKSVIGDIITTYDLNRIKE